MGKGDKKSRRGKIVKGSYGVSRPKKDKNRQAGVRNKEEEKKSAKK